MKLELLIHEKKQPEHYYQNSIFETSKDRNFNLAPTYLFTSATRGSGDRVVERWTSLPPFKSSQERFSSVSLAVSESDGSL